MASSGLGAQLETISFNVYVRIIPMTAHRYISKVAVTPRSLPLRHQQYGIQKTTTIHFIKFNTRWNYNNNHRSWHNICTNYILQKKVKQLNSLIPSSPAMANMGVLLRNQQIWIYFSNTCASMGMLLPNDYMCTDFSNEWGLLEQSENEWMWKP